jgi:GT2 family glycosyltransferase
MTNLFSKSMMRVIKTLVGMMPKGTRVKMREHIWLHNLYSKSLRNSGLFYGFPSAKKLQKLYLKNIVQQQVQIAEQVCKADEYIDIDCLVVLTGQKNVDFKTIQNAYRQLGNGKLFLLGKMSLIKDYTADPLLDFEVFNFNQYFVQDSSGHLMVIRAGDTVHFNALLLLAQLSLLTKNESVTYCDIDHLDHNDNRHLAEFYPDWNPDLQLSTGYVKTGILIKGNKSIKYFSEFSKVHYQTNIIALWMLSIYLTNKNIEIKHTPFCLVHQFMHKTQSWAEQLKILGQSQISVSLGANKQCVKVFWKHTTKPLVSLIIPTKNAKELVKSCIDSIVEKTTYKNYEILLIDNNSDDAEALSYFKHLQHTHPKVRLLPYPYVFNYSAINNFAVRQAKGEIIGLINNDIEVISPSWLSDMVAHVQRADIGCVGAKLLYPDDRIQHAGVVLGYGGGAGHAHKYFPRFHPGYLNRLVATHNYSAVTAACLLVKKTDYEAVNGLNEKDLTVAFNDVDFCLNILKLGRRNIYCAEAELYHHESVSRGHEDTKEKQKRFQSELDFLLTQWASYIDHDPAYNPNLTLRRENFSIKEV